MFLSITIFLARWLLRWLLSLSAECALPARGGCRVGGGCAQAAGRAHSRTAPRARSRPSGQQQLLRRTREEEDGARGPGGAETRVRALRHPSSRALEDAFLPLAPSASGRCRAHILGCWELRAQVTTCCLCGHRTGAMLER
ncbi:hypothetical protein NDU88_004328 [Pleurodeles waltl]|uniref:Secreted protein n=1 Tax=Pleurodeles waltl TaxID=8319 RepID=A0AAV7RL01_PLEWA|nr:hypothetical protein NDU88_004328 [Pleurodeles waltl]